MPERTLNIKAFPVKSCCFCINLTNNSKTTNLITHSYYDRKTTFPYAGSIDRSALDF